MLKENRQIKKNILDIEYNKYLQFLTSSIIILFTYFIGLFIALITRGIDYTNKNHLILMVIISIAFISIATILLLRFKRKMRNIIIELENLKNLKFASYIIKN